MSVNFLIICTLSLLLTTNASFLSGPVGEQEQQQCEGRLSLHLTNTLVKVVTNSEKKTNIAAETVRKH